MMRQTLFAISCLCVLALIAAPLPSLAQKNKTEIGKCGYYADSFQGRPTASGEKYNKDALTCSHKTMAFGTKIRVTRLDNKKSVVVRVNDRGPFVEGYIVDVSMAAAKELDMIKAGSVRVKIEVVETAQSALTNDAQLEAEAFRTLEPNQIAKGVNANTASRAQFANTQTNDTPVTHSNSVATKTNAAPTAKVAPSSNLFKVDIAESQKKGFGVQIVSLSDANGVLPFVRELQAKYPGKVLVNVKRDEMNNPTYKAIVGPFADKKSADAAQKTISQKYKKTIVVDLSLL
ncbi:MAG: septal ring lytic transglycosylase RlpA family protein [Saprospiraceae bacterium]|nr:septal ring lytic transglycosylase RlpA family protein [Saprospiraceae bacterium]